MPQHLLSVVSDEKGEQIFVHLDKNGIALLMKSLQRLLNQLEKGECDHDHLITEEWGGSGELTLSKLEDQKDEHHMVHHVKLYSWTDEWKMKHNLAKE